MRARLRRRGARPGAGVRRVRPFGLRCRYQRTSSTPSWRGCSPGSPDAAEHLVPVVPTSVLEHFGQAHSFTIRIGGARPPAMPSAGTRRLPPPHPAAATRRAGHGAAWRACDPERRRRRGRDPSPRESRQVARGQCVPRIAAVLPDGRRLVRDRCGLRARLARGDQQALPQPRQTVDLPPWYLPRGRTEYDYNSDAAVRRRGYLCLDRNASVRDPLGARSSLEICDLLGPRNELIHVKRAKGSAPLSHLFSQGLVSAQSLVSGPPTVRERFTATVAALPGGRTLPADFKPRRSLRHPDGERQAAHPRHAVPVLPATLAHAARILGGYGIDVEVTAIPAV